MNPIVEHAIKILMILAEKETEEVEGDEIRKITGLEIKDINNAVAYLEDLGAVDVLKWLGTGPYDFGSVSVTPRGIYLYHETRERALTSQKEEGELLPERPINPVGSPFGFTDADWEFVVRKKADRNTLNVVFGLQYESKYYNTDELVTNIGRHFEKTVESYNKSHSENKITLKFEKLAAGYGEHLFNAIARSIIGSDIAIFEVSDQNPNVMIELGVALTWGVRVLPLKEQNRPKPPTDISGQTWIDYEKSGEKILDGEFYEKLEKMIERAIGKKGLSK